MRFRTLLLLFVVVICAARPVFAEGPAEQCAAAYAELKTNQCGLPPPANTSNSPQDPATVKWWKCMAAKTTIQSNQCKPSADYFDSNGCKQWYQTWFMGWDAFEAKKQSTCKKAKEWDAKAAATPTKYNKFYAKSWAGKCKSISQTIGKDALKAKQTGVSVDDILRARACEECNGLVPKDLNPVSFEKQPGSAKFHTEAYAWSVGDFMPGCPFTPDAPTFNP